MTTAEIRIELKESKVARGCRMLQAVNCLTIVYPQHKMFNDDRVNHPFSFENSPFTRDLEYIMNNFSSEAKRGTIVHKHRNCIQIYVD